MKRRGGVIQLPVVRTEFVAYNGNLHWRTGIRCPRCQVREVVYNGNYFCSGLDNKTCEWALPHYEPNPEFPQYDEPKELWDLVDALIKSQMERKPKERKTKR